MYTSTILLIYEIMDYKYGWGNDSLCCGYNWVVDNKWTSRGTSCSSIGDLDRIFSYDSFLVVGRRFLSRRKKMVSCLLFSFFSLDPKIIFLDPKGSKISSQKSPFSSSFLLFKWESLRGNFSCSPFLNDDFRSYVTPSATLAVGRIVTSQGRAA